MAGNPADCLASERTVLAWVRTARVIPALGFVVVKSGLVTRKHAGNSLDRQGLDANQRSPGTHRRRTPPGGAAALGLYRPHMLLT